MSLATTEHTVRAFDTDLQDLKRMIAEMGGHAERQITQAITALMKRDSARAKSVVIGDVELDAQQRAIEQKSVETIATRQPMAVDLRELIAVLRIANELERIGDLAKNIGKRVIVLNAETMPRQPLRGIVHMGNLATHLLKDVLDSYAQRDSKKAMLVWNRDEEIDSMYTSLFRELLTCMTEDPGIVPFGIHLHFCAKNIERVGDHATNIAESVYYIVEGRVLGADRPKADTTCFMDIPSFSETLESID